MNVARGERAWTEVNLDNLTHNLKVIEEHMQKGCKVMAVVKANAYGHGSIPVSMHLAKIGVRNFAVATIDEAIELREAGLQGDILILGFTSPERGKELVDYDLIQTVTDCSYGEKLSCLGFPVKVHIKVDTGMHRLGELCGNSVKIKDLFHRDNLKICGIFTHLSAADSRKSDDVEFTKNQIYMFYCLLRQLKKEGITLPEIHIQGSYGFLNYSELKCDYIRMGIALYGVLSEKENPTELTLDLKPVLELKSKVVLVRELDTGEKVSYGGFFSAERKTVEAVISVGYADGIPREFSCGKGHVLINGKEAPIIGRVCMDQLMADVTDIPGVKEGDTVTLIGCDGGKELTAEDAAFSAGTITNDILTRLGSRLKRIYIG